MNPHSFFPEPSPTIPPSVAMAANVVGGSIMPHIAVSDPASLQSIAAANHLLQAYVSSEILAERVINNLMKGIAESVAESALQLPNMPPDEICMEIDRLNLLADLMSAAKRAVGRDSNHYHPFDQPWVDNEQGEAGGENQAVPGF